MVIVQLSIPKHPSVNETNRSLPLNYNIMRGVVGVTVRIE